jgi:hypothetical protein
MIDAAAQLKGFAENVSNEKLCLPKRVIYVV